MTKHTFVNFVEASMVSFLEEMKTDESVEGNSNQAVKER